MLIARAEVEGRAPLDVRVRAGRVVDIASRLAPARDEEVVDARGGALIPGLHDHHLHLLALAAALGSVRCGPPQVEEAGALGCALGAAPVGPDGWVRGVGYHESVAGPLDRARLDALGPDVPVRVQHRSGGAWFVNSAGVSALGLDAGADASGVERDARGRATGRLFRLDAWLRERLPRADAPDLARVGRRLAGAGVTAATDATPDIDAGAIRLLAGARARGDLPQALWLMGGASLPDPPGPGLHLGAVKRMLDERTLPLPDALAAEVRAAHAAGRPFAAHCATRAEAVVALAALRAAGARPGDRLEHAFVAPPDVATEAAALGVAVVVQPGFVFERGDAYLRDVAPADRPWLHRGRGFVEAGAALGGGTDAPFGEPDPWRAMRAAVERRTRSGRALGPAESLSPERALALFTTSADAPGGTPRRVRPGAAADLCLLAVPWCAARRAPSRDAVAMTLCRGVPVATE